MKKFNDNIISFKTGEKELGDILYNEGKNYSFIDDFNILSDLCSFLTEKKDIKLLIKEMYLYSRNNSEKSILKEKLLNILLKNKNINDVFSGLSNSNVLLNVLNQTSLSFYQSNKDFFVKENLSFIHINQSQKRKLYIQDVYKNIENFDFQENLENGLHIYEVNDQHILKNQINLIKQLKEMDICFFNEIIKEIFPKKEDSKNLFSRLFIFKISDTPQSQKTKEKYIFELLEFIRKEDLKFSKIIKYENLYELNIKEYDVNILKYITQYMIRINDAEMLNNYKKYESDKNINTEIKTIMSEYEKGIILNKLDLNNNIINVNKKRL